MEIYLIETSELRKSDYIDDNISEKALLTSLTLAQETMLKPILGTALYEKIINDIKAGTITDVYKDLCFDKIADVLMYYTVYQLTVAKAFKISNMNVGKADTEQSTAVELAELRSFKKSIQSIYGSYERTLQQHLKGNTDIFPEYLTYVSDDVDANKNTNNPIVFDLSSIL